MTEVIISTPGDCVNQLLIRDTRMMKWNRIWYWQRLIHINSKTFPEIRSESKLTTTFWVIPEENCQEKENIWKSNPVKFVFYWKSSIWYHTGFRLSQPFSLKWNWFVQMVNAIMAGGKFTFCKICLPFLNRELTGLPTRNLKI